MKKYLIFSLLATLHLAGASACDWSGPTHNCYMFSVYQHDALTYGPEYLYDISEYWNQYAGGKGKVGVDFYRNNSDAVMDAARNKGDVEMRRYLALLNRYIKVCDDYTYDAWEYPSKQQLAQRQRTLASILATVRAYKGKALSEQYLLLNMRLNMMMRNDAANVALWKSSASRMRQSPWREAMRNIYARALLKSGQRQQACDIYAEQGDVKSIRSVMGNYRNIAGIKDVFAKNPNAPTLEYLVQDFVNNVQETIDQSASGAVDNDWFETIDAKVVYRKDAAAFVAFANAVAKNAEVKSPSMWLAAASMVDYLLGNQQQAMAEADRAVGAAGKSRMVDNARAIRLLVSTRSNVPSEQYSKFLLGEFKWLDGKIAEENGSCYEYRSHYTDVKDRVVHKGLEPMYRSAGKGNAALSMCAMMSSEMACDEDSKMSYSPWDEYFCKMDTLTADGLAGYYKYLSSSHSDGFENYCASHTFRNADYFNDLIGTKMIAEGRFSDAVEYMEKVPLAFLGKQRISVYAAVRRYDRPRWFGKQVVDSGDEEPVAVSANEKLSFCRDMTELVSRYSLLREGEPKRQLAYDIAVRYYQASCYGDCWYLTHYYRSVQDSARAWEKDFAAETVKYLNVAKQSDDMKLRYKAIYALAFMPVDPWYSVEYDKDYNLVMRLRHDSRQYVALGELDQFARQHPDCIDDYTRRCDVLRRFRGE